MNAAVAEQLGCVSCVLGEDNVYSGQDVPDPGGEISQVAYGCAHKVQRGEELSARFLWVVPSGLREPACSGPSDLCVCWAGSSLEDCWLYITGSSW